MSSLEPSMIENSEPRCFSRSASPPPGIFAESSSRQGIIGNSSLYGYVAVQPILAGAILPSRRRLHGLAEETWLTKVFDGRRISS